METEKFLNGHYSFDGYTGTEIFYDNETGQKFSIKLLCHEISNLAKPF